MPANTKFHAHRTNKRRRQNAAKSAQLISTSWVHHAPSEEQLLRMFPELAKDEVMTVDASTIRPGDSGPVAVITEAGLYSVIMRSDEPEARKFQDWLCGEVLPSIRKSGGYLVDGEARNTAYVSGRNAIPTPAEIQEAFNRAGHDLVFRKYGQHMKRSRARQSAR